MTRKKIIIMLVFANIMIFGTFGVSGYLLVKYLRDYKQPAVQGADNTKTTGDAKSADNLTLNLTDKGKEALFALRQDGDVNILQYDNGTQSQPIAQYSFGNSLMKIEDQLAFSSNEGIFFLQSDLKGYQIVNINPQGKKVILYTTSKPITSMKFMRGDLYFIIAATHSNDASKIINSLYKFDPRLQTSSKLSQFNGTQQYYISSMDNQKIQLARLDQGKCYQYLLVSKELLVQDCLDIVPLNAVSKEYVVVRKLIRDPSLPESFPIDQIDFQEFVYTQTEYEKTVSENLSTDSLEAIYSGEINQNLEMLTMDDNYLYLINQDKSTQKSLLVEVKRVPKLVSKNKRKQYQFETYALPQTSYKYLGDKQLRGELFFDFYQEFKNGGKAARLFAFDIDEKIFRQYDLPECPLDTNVCELALVN